MYAVNIVNLKRCDWSTHAQPTRMMSCICCCMLVSAGRTSAVPGMSACCKPQQVPELNNRLHLSSCSLSGKRRKHVCSELCNSPWASTKANPWQLWLFSELACIGDCSRLTRQAALIALPRCAGPRVVIAAYAGVILCLHHLCSVLPHAKSIEHGPSTVLYACRSLEAS